MKTIIANLWEKCNSPSFLRGVHGWLSIFWLVSSIPIMLWLRDYVWVVSLMSVYALFVGHWSSWQAGRVEVAQFEDANVQDVMDKLVELEREIKRNGKSIYFI